MGGREEMGGGWKGMAGNVAVGPREGTKQGPNAGPELSNKAFGLRFAQNRGRHSEL